MAIIAMGATVLATPARAGVADGPCPRRIADQLISIAEKACKAQGKEMVVTWMNCENGVADFAYECV
jgi:hypothetical protein